MRILVAEDDDTLRRAIRSLLRHWGHEVVDARDGHEASTAAAGAARPEIAILDWDMPGRTGLDVCRALRERSDLPYTYVILLTGRSAQDDRILGLDAGADDYVVKPFDPRELEARLKTAARLLSLQPQASAEQLPDDDGAVVETVRLCPWSSDRRLSAEAMEAILPVGRALGGGKYRLETLLGNGASGLVYRAHQAGLDRPIALKILNPLHQNDPDRVARFHREAVATSMLDHPNVLRVFDFGREADGTAFLAMELLCGRTLDVLLDEEGGRLPAGRAVEIMSQVCAALSAAHERGIVHRDVKPENIVVAPATDDAGSPVDAVKLCDFGIAKIVASRDEEDDDGKLTAAGAVWGTPRYMSPEQARDGAVDARADLYSCGVILYQMVTGRLPFVAKNALGFLAKHVLEEPPPPTAFCPDLDPRLEAVILEALSKSPADRPQTARELRFALRGLLSITATIRHSTAEDAVALCGAA